MSVADGMAAVDSAAATITKAEHEAALATAREEGRKAGLEAGEKAGFAKGHAEGLAAGKIEGKADGETIGRAAGATAERERILGIEELGLKGHEKLVATLKADGKTSPAEAAIQILKAEKETGGAKLAQIAADGASGAAAAPLAQPANTKQPESAALLADTTKPLDDRCKAAFAADASLRAEFGSLGALVAYQRAVENGQVKIFKPAR